MIAQPTERLPASSRCPFSGLLLSTGRVGDEGLFRLDCLPDLPAFNGNTFSYDHLEPLPGSPLAKAEITAFVGKSRIEKAATGSRSAD